MSTCVCVYLHLSGYISFILNFLNLIKRLHQESRRGGPCQRLTELAETADSPTQIHKLYFGRDIGNKWSKSCCRSPTDDQHV